MYYLWHTKMLGWFNQTGTYGTDFTKAKKFTQAEALDRVKRFRSESGFTVLPVREEDLT